jgi:hypothetical protein
MRELSLGKSVSSVTLMQRDTSGDLKPVTLYKRRRKKKGSTWGLRGLETVVCRTLDAQKAFADTLREETQKSRRRTKNGWLLDLGNNVFKAISSGRKEVRLDRWI